MTNASATVANSVGGRTMIEGIAVPHFDLYAGLWAIEEQRGRALANIDLQAHLASVRSGVLVVGDKGGEVQSRVVDGVMVFELIGSMTKFGTSLSSAPGSGVSVDDARPA
jgi:hypothetical protein